MNIQNDHPSVISHNHTERQITNHTYRHTQKNLSPVLATVPWCRYHLGHCSLFHFFWPKVGGASPIGYISYNVCNVLWVVIVISCQKTRENNHDLTAVYMEYIKSINATNLGHFINSYIRYVLTVPFNFIHFMYLLTWFLPCLFIYLQTYLPRRSVVC